MFGNEQADQLAKDGARAEQPNIKEKVIIIKAVTKAKQDADAYHCLNRTRKVVMVRLRSENTN